MSPGQGLLGACRLPSQDCGIKGDAGCGRVTGSTFQQSDGELRHHLAVRLVH
jgi:hypothetical protein